jgi:hypothetical protein
MASEWDCESGGLLVQPGDEVQVVGIGTAR